MLNLGGLFFTLDADTRGLMNAQRRLERFAGDVRSAFRGVGKGTVDPSLANQLARQERAVVGSLERIKKVQDQIRRSGIGGADQARLLDQLGRAYDNYSRKMASGPVNNLDFGRRQQHISSQINDIQRQFKALETSARSDLQGLQRVFNEIGRAARVQVRVETRAAQQEVSALARAFREVGAAARAAEAEAARYARIQFNAGQQALNLRQTLANARIDPAARQRLEQQVLNAQSNLSQRFAGGNVSSTQAAEFQRQWTSAINNVKRELAGLQRLPGPDVRGWQNFSGVLHGIGSASLFVQGHLGGMSTRFFALTGLVREFGVVAAIASAAVAGLSVGMGVLASHAINVGKAFEGSTVAMTAVSGSAALASTHLAFVKSVAMQTGVEFTNSAKAFTRFLASGQAAGLALRDIQSSFRGVAVAGATLQISQDDLQGVFRALDQIMSKGKVQAEELRGQLGDRLPAAFAIAARSMGVTTRELDKMMKKGQVVSQDFVPKFVKTMLEVYGIDISKPVDTLTASLGRLSNSWTFFGIALNQATGATRVMKGFVEGLGGALDWAGQNMAQVLGAIGALTGALAGLAVAMALPMIIGWISSLSVLSGWIMIVVRSVGAWAAVQVVLNAAVASFPLTRVITIIVTLVAVIAGAVIGYNMLSNAVNANNAALGDVSGIMSYIEMQKQLGFQVRATTEEFIRQAEVASRAASATAMEHFAKASKTANNPGITDYAMSVAQMWRPGMTPGRMKSPSGFANDRARREVEAGNEALKTFRKWEEVREGLNQVISLPDQPVTPPLPADASGKTKKEKSLDSIINRIKDLQDAARTAGAQLDALMAGPDQIDRIGDLGEALRIVNNLKPKEIAKAAEVLGVANDLNTVTGAIQGLIVKTREANEVVQDFTQIWQNLDTGKRELANITRQIEYLNKVNGDVTRQPGQLGFLEKLGEAEEMIERLGRRGEAGQKAIAAISARLKEAGYEGETAAERIAHFFWNIDMAREQVRVMEQFGQKLREVREEAEKLSTLSQALTSIEGSGFKSVIKGSLFNADIGEAAERAYARGEAVREYRRELERIGSTQEYINTKTTEYMQALREVDNASYAFDRVKEAADRNRDAMRSMATDTLTSIRDLAFGVKSLEDVLRDLATQLLEMGWERFVIQPAQDWMNNLGRNKGEEAVAGLDTKVAGTDGVAALGAAAANAAGAVNDNFIGAIISSATQTMSAAATEAGAAATKMAADAQLAAMGMTASAALTTLAASAAAASAAMASMAAQQGMSAMMSAAGSVGAGHAVGGPMTAGHVYPINEPGVMGEYFIPSVNGYMSNTAPGGSGGGVMYLDASTTIDARGATKDAIAELEARLWERDQRLRSELPYMVDARVIDSSKRRRY
jgi:tape measure domain-containing protein